MKVKKEVMRCAQDNTNSFVHFNFHFYSHFNSHLNFRMLEALKESYALCAGQYKFICQF